MADNSSSSVAIVAIVLLMLVAGFFFFTRGDSGGPAKTVNVDLNLPKPEIPKPAN